MNLSHRQSGAVSVIIMSLLVVLMAGVLGFVIWQKYFAPKTTVTKTETQQQTTETPTAKKDCEDNEDVTATDGTFCSIDLGIKLSIPLLFKGRLVVAENYDVYKSGLDPATKEKVGTSDVVYAATIEGNDNLKLEISQEPVRTGYTNAPHKLQDTYYDEKTGLLSNVTTPTQTYDPQTNKLTTTGEYKVGETVPSFTVSSTKVYKAVIADAGTGIVTYFGIVNDKIVMIKLTTHAYMGDPAKDPSTIDASTVMDDLDKAVKKMTVFTAKSSS